MSDPTASRDAFDLFSSGCRYNFRRRVLWLFYQAIDLIKLTVLDTYHRVCSRKVTP